jgi:heme exporter protein D
MYFDSVSAALAMDGHGVYVWSAYFITAIAIALIMTIPVRRSRKFLQQLAGEIRRQRAHDNSSAGAQ